MSNMKTVDNANEFMSAFSMYQYYIGIKPNRVYTEAALQNYCKHAKKNIRNSLLKLTGDEYSTALELLEMEFGDYTQFM